LFENKPKFFYLIFGFFNKFFLIEEVGEKKVEISLRR